MKKTSSLIFCIIIFHLIPYIPIYADDDTPYPFGPKGKIIGEAYVESSGILEYGLFNVPIGGTNDIDVYMRFLLFPGLEKGMPELGGRYILDAASVRLIENNTALSINVRRLMSRHGCNGSVTFRDNSNGSTTFWFNFLNSDNNHFETWVFNAYRR